ncbi:response regulator [Pseudomaricurvus sp.]|uniref:response regulator n=1 Tax=Pseudomaricurvus sp. TaxID=2004510 RepID=UPI003F6CF9A6
MINLLLVEDDEDDYIITRDFLNDLNGFSYQLDWARTPEQARDYFQKDSHDVCLLDYSLGALTGLELLREAKQLGFHAPIIMLTGHDDQDLDESALSAGAVDYLVKSQLSSARLSRAIRYAVARKDMEQERVKRIQAQAENRSKSEFLAHLSHELRTPLTAILGYTDLLSNLSDNKTSQDYIQIIKRNGNYLLNLLNDVLDLSKIDAGKLDIQRQPVSLDEVLSNLVGLMEIKAHEKGIEFTVTADEALPQTVITDATRLQQVLINIIGNAIKFTDDGSVDVKLEVRDGDSLQSEVNRCTLVFHVHDTGIGLDNKELARLFLPFEQIQNTDRKTEPGTGLGLAISQKLTERLGGEITATSVEGRGSCFSVRISTNLPDGVSWKPLNINKQQADIKEATNSLDARILIADDLAEIRHLLGHMVQRHGASVEFAENGREALEKVQSARLSNTHFDLVLMDMQMPVMDGLEATRRLRNIGFDQPVIALTAQTMLGEKEKCLAAGCTEHLGKPVLEQHLVSCIQRHLSNLSTKSKSLLLVEDNHDARNATQILLEGLGWKVSSCADVTSAYHLLEEQKFDLVLTDINLPDGDGVSLARAIVDQFTRPPKVIAVSGKSMDVGEESPFTEALLKPLNLNQLGSLDRFLGA